MRGLARGQLPVAGHVAPLAAVARELTKTHEQIGHAGLTGWRQTVADKVAPPTAKRGPVTEDQVQAVIGATFYVLSLWYVITTTAKIFRQLRS